MHMDGRRKLAEAFGAWADRHGYTQSQIAAMGGPSTTTQTKLRLGEGVVSRHTLRQLDAVMGWPAGSAARVIDGGEVPADNTPEIVSGPGDAGSSLLVLRPNGLTDDEWASIVEESRGHLEWLVEKAARKRREQQG